MGIAEIVLAVGLVLAIARGTRLLVIDEFPPVRWLRTKSIRAFATVDQDGVIHPDVTRWGRLARLVFPLAYLWTCLWCMSVWVGLAAWLLADWRLSVPYPALIIAVGSLVSGWLGYAEEQAERREILEGYAIRDGHRETRRRE